MLVGFDSTFVRILRDDVTVAVDQDALENKKGHSKLSNLFILAPRVGLEPTTHR